MEATSWKRQLGSDNDEGITWKRQRRGDNVEATTWKRQRGSDNVNAEATTLTWKRQRNVEATTWKRQRGSDNLGAPSWKRQHRKRQCETPISFIRNTLVCFFLKGANNWPSSLYFGHFEFQTFFRPCLS